ncbi:hypothetical protein Hanom_Chr03g00183041 [Helianthus anomalus]
MGRVQVSLYGHSLGSVLSYDILCHQETLSSPFPMEWMYTGQTHEISPERNSSVNSPENDIVTNNEGMDTVASHTEGANGKLSIATDSEKDDSPVLDEVVVKSGDDPIEMQSENNEVLTSDSSQVDEEINENDESVVIKSLKEEVMKFNTAIFLNF